MPEVYKKFRDSQGLASISRALKASQAAQEADIPEKEREKTRTPEARKESRRPSKDLEGARGVDTGVQSSSPALKQKKDNKGKESEGGQPDRDAKASGTKDGPRKKKRKSEATAGSAAGKDAESAPSAPGHGPVGAGLISISEAVDPPTKKTRKAGAVAGSTAGNEAPEEHEREQGAPAQTFRDFYVKTFSSAFASELFDLRQAEGERLSLDLLLRHMESGINIFSDTERELLQQGRTMS
ncbi:g3556 [Coccomyxa viridis]|uniref:G3556 protein n=1 Tax=Coccomyxa viridis TaxID=1274662 RepID=A0ABP1FN40_9CHLO